jgi:hypothetical protein
MAAAAASTSECVLRSSCGPGDGGGGCGALKTRTVIPRRQWCQVFSTRGGSVATSAVTMSRLLGGGVSGGTCIYLTTTTSAPRLHQATAQMEGHATHDGFEFASS